ncbi:MAG: hypothetical protein ACI4SG_06010 [Oligosphaeraceae bacterium]
MTPHEEPRSTQFLVLRKTPFDDRTIIIGGLSPELGKLTLKMPAPALHPAKARPFFDLFQILQVDFHPRGEWGKCRKFIPLRDFSGLAQHRAHFEAACTLARLALDNLLPQMPMPAFYQALVVGLQRLAQDPLPPDATLTAAGLTLLNESGLLSPVTLSPREAAQCQLLLQMAAGDPPPNLPATLWTDLWQWTQGKLLEAEFQLP